MRSCFGTEFQVLLRYYPPEKQGLRHFLSPGQCKRGNLRYYPPEKQGLRPDTDNEIVFLYRAQILSSRKTRIKTQCRH